MSPIDNILTALEQANPAPEQKELLEAWLNVVLAPALEETVRVRGVTLAVGGDLSILEACVSVSADLAKRLSSKLLEECGVPVPGRRQEQVLLSLLEETGSDDVTLWCCLRHLGAAKPKADCGFTVHGKIPWTLADLLIPQSDDVDAVRDYAQQGQSPVEPTGLGTSLFPCMNGRPRGQHLLFDIVDEQKSLKPIVFGLGFLKSLNFVKPRDDIVKALSRSKPRTCVVRIFAEDNGMAQAQVCFGTTSKLTFRDVADAMLFKPKTEEFDRIWKLAGCGFESAQTLEIRADATGVCLAVSWRLITG